MKQIFTLVYLVRDDAICLGQKKRGFGKGNWNGFGGKVEVDETVEDAAVRELKEESGVMTEVAKLKKVAVIDFFFTDGRHLEVHAYFVRSWEGQPKETNEMKPSWFAFNDIPYEKMWADDRYWLPRALGEEKLRGKVWFKNDGARLEKMEWIAVLGF